MEKFRTIYITQNIYRAIKLSEANNKGLCEVSRQKIKI